MNALLARAEDDPASPAARGAWLRAGARLARLRAGRGAAGQLRRGDARHRQRAAHAARPERLGGDRGGAREGHAGACRRRREGMHRFRRSACPATGIDPDTADRRSGRGRPVVAAEGRGPAPVAAAAPPPRPGLGGAPRSFARRPKRPEPGTILVDDNATDLERHAGLGRYGNERRAPAIPLRPSFKAGPSRNAARARKSKWTAKVA